MFTIKQASRLTGVPASTLRAWERRYSVVRPDRNDSGYRVYDKAAIAAIIGFRRLIDSGWSPAEAARALRDGAVEPGSPPDLAAAHDRDVRRPGVVALHDFLAAAANLDSVGLDASLDQGFASGSFEFVVEHWLFPALVALGEGWACGEIDVAGEHLASQAVRRRLAAAFDAAGWRTHAPSVLVGLPAGCQHDLGAYAFAIAARRRGLDVTFLGADVPISSWTHATKSRAVDAAVLSVVMAEDRQPAVETAMALLAADPGLVVAAGGAHSPGLHAGVMTLPAAVGDAAGVLDDLLHR